MTKVVSLISFCGIFVLLQSCQSPEKQRHPVSCIYTMNTADPQKAELQPRGNRAYEIHGKVIVPPSTLSELEFSKDGLATMATDSFGWLFVKRDGTTLQAKFFDNGPDNFSEHLARYLDHHKVGFIDESGNIVIKARFGFASPFQNGYAIACNHFAYQNMGEDQFVESDRWGCINKTGRLVIPMKYSSKDIQLKVTQLPRL